MTLYDIYIFVSGLDLDKLSFWSTILAVVVFLTMTFVEVSKLKVNPWSWLATRLGRAINGEVMAVQKEQGQAITDLAKDVKEQGQKADEREATNRRIRILRFGDELSQGQLHSKEHFDQALDDIDYYERYCREHPDFVNSKAVITISNIKSAYTKCAEKNNFV